MRSSTIFTVAGVTLVTGAVAYALWFDSKRRNDAEFRKKLRKEKKRIEKTAAVQQQQNAEAAAAGPVSASPAELRAAIEKVKAEQLPESPDEKEQYFMMQVNMGEQLCGQGAAFALPAAMCFFRALRVYPSPVELIMIYQQTVPEPIFKLVIEMTQLDMKSRIEGYWDQFPPKDMNVSVKPVDIPIANGVTRKRVLVVTKDVQAGDVIYKESPIVAALDADLEGKGTHCSHCFKSMDPESAIRPESDKFGSTYCSKECELKATTEYESLLFAKESPISSDVDPTNTPETAAKRAEAQDALIALIKRTAKAGPLLAARFVARQVSGELAKLFPGVVPSAPNKQFAGGEFTLYDHMERLRYLELEVPEEEGKALRDLFEFTMAGLEQAIADERYAMLKGKFSYNAYGVFHGEGRNDKPEPVDERPEDKERARTTVGTSKQIGSAFYFVSSYMQHDCEPSARVAFQDGTTELSLVAARDLKAGEELTVAYVDVAQHEGETLVAARRRRRMELARGWRFPCPCERCEREAQAPKEEGEAKEDDTKDDAGDGDTFEVAGDESKVETIVSHREEEENEEFKANVD